MRRASRLLAFTSVLILAAFCACPRLAAQRRPNATPFPDDDAGLSPSRGHSVTVSGVVFDAESHSRLSGVRVDLQAIAGGILASEFTGANGGFEFTNVRPGNYQLIFEQTGYSDSREQVEVEGPMFGMNVALRKLGAGIAGSGGPTVSVHQLSIPQKARDAMSKGMSLLYQKSDYPGSIKQFQRAIQAYPDFYEAYAQIGIAYLRMKDSAQSEQALRKSVELSQGNYPDALFLLAALLSGSQRYADAEPLARKAVATDPDSWRAQSELAQALLGLKRADEAEKYGEDAVKLQPDNPTLHLLLADIHIALRNAPALLDDLNSYLRLAPDGPYAAKVREQKDRIQQKMRESQAPPDSPPPSQGSH